MRFRNSPSVIIHFVVLICVVSQGGGETLPPAEVRPGVERITKPREEVGVTAEGRSVGTLPPTGATLPAKEEERPPRRTLSSETENVLLLLLGIILLLIFTASRLGFTKNDKEPAKLDTADFR